MRINPSMFTTHGINNNLKSRIFFNPHPGHNMNSKAEKATEKCKSVYMYMYLVHNQSHSEQGEAYLAFSGRSDSLLQNAASARVSPSATQSRCTRAREGGRNAGCTMTSLDDEADDASHFARTEPKIGECDKFSSDASLC